jgi:glutaryl-CoA dehydrogenase
MGNAAFADYIIVWAKNREDKNQNIQGFVVEKGSPGMNIKKITGKLSLRMT